MYRTEWHGVDNSGDVSEEAGADWLENVVSPRALAVAETMFLAIIVPTEWTREKFLPKSRIRASFHPIFAMVVLIIDDLSHPGLLSKCAFCPSTPKLSGCQPDRGVSPEGRAWGFRRLARGIALR